MRLFPGEGAMIADGDCSFVCCRSRRVSQTAPGKLIESEGFRVCSHCRAPFLARGFLLDGSQAGASQRCCRGRLASIGREKARIIYVRSCRCTSSEARCAQRRPARGVIVRGSCRNPLRGRPSASSRRFGDWFFSEDRFERRSFRIASAAPFLIFPFKTTARFYRRWCDEGVTLLRGLTIPRLQIRLIIDQGSVAPSLTMRNPSVSLSVERDPLEYRGSGGVLRDVTAGYDDSDYLLVANAAQIVVENLLSVTSALIERDADIALVSHSDGSPGGFMLARCGAARHSRHRLC